MTTLKPPPAQILLGNIIVYTNNIVIARLVAENATLQHRSNPSLKSGLFSFIGRQIRWKKI